MEPDQGPLPDKKTLLGFLERICRSQEISGSKRLQEFLIYVVTETLEGRGAQIFGKTIAEDVYHRPPTSSADSSNLVRVDAGRLRRALDAYYSGEGAQDPVRFHIDPGQYAVRFETRQMAAPDRPRYHRRLLIAAAVLFLLVAAGVSGLAIVSFSGLLPPRTADSGNGLSSAQREALMNRSPATLEAVDLARQARGLIFPASNPARLIATRGMFERAIELAPEYYGAHAGLAQIAGLQSFFFPAGGERDATIELGFRHAQKARDLNPASPWTQSALGWVEFARGNVGQARAYSAHAVDIAPDDLDVLDFDSMIATFAGDFQHVVETANPADFDGRNLKRHVFTVAFAVANYHLGNDTAAIAALNESASLGGPTSPISYAYLIAAHQRSGQEVRARALLRDFETSWPNSPLERLLRRLFVRAQDADALFDALRAAGWNPAAD